MMEMEDTIRRIVRYSEETFGNSLDEECYYGRYVANLLCELVMDHPTHDPAEVVEGFIFVMEGYKQYRTITDKEATLVCDVGCDVAYDIWTMLKGDMN